MIKRALQIVIGAIGLLTAVAPAAAQTYVYTSPAGQVITIDTATKTGTLVGPNISATFSGAGLGTFTGGANPTTMINIDNVTGTYVLNGQTLSPNTNHQQMLVFKSGELNFWSLWGPAANPNSIDLYGDYILYNPVFSTPPTTSSSTGGATAVPEPADFALFGLAIAGLMFARRKSMPKTLATA
jgi:hypothetical protein